MERVEVSWALMADFANVDAAGKVNIIGCFAEINAPALPFELQTMFLAAMFEAPPVEIGSTKTLKVVLVDSDAREVLFNQEVQTVVQEPPPHAAKGKPVTLQLIMGLNGLIFKKAGDYAFNVLVNGETKKTLSLRVNEPKLEIKEK